MQYFKLFYHIQQLKARQRDYQHQKENTWQAIQQAIDAQHFQDADTLLDQLLLIDRRAPAVSYQKSSISMRLGRFEDTATHLLHALEQSPLNARYHYDVGVLLYHIQDWCALFNQYLVHLEDEQMPRIHDSTFANVGDAQSQLVAAYRELARTSPCVDHYLKWGNACMVAHDLSEAMRAYGEVVQCDSQHGTGYQNLSIALSLDGQVLAGEVAMGHA
ncbi:hypothetical protein C2W62_36365 [Candidatus Entotheonella serta]|nr:hypothetical protein C2W62_36365 [Candidatus Entotheonella serta]